MYSGFQLGCRNISSHIKEKEIGIDVVTGRISEPSQVPVCVCLTQWVTGAGDVDGPLHVLLPEHNSCCSGFGLCVFLHFPLQSRRWRDKVALLSPDWQETWDMMLSFQRPFNFLKRKHNLETSCRNFL